MITMIFTLSDSNWHFRENEFLSLLKLLFTTDACLLNFFNAINLDCLLMLNLSLFSRSYSTIDGGLWDAQR